MTSTIAGAMTAANTVAVAVVVAANIVVIAVAIAIADGKYVHLYRVLTDHTVV